MATRKPLVLVDGRLQQLPEGEQIAGVSVATQKLAGVVRTNRYEAELLWSGTAGAGAVPMLSRELLVGELVMIRHTSTNTPVSGEKPYIPSIYTVGPNGGVYMHFSAFGTINTLVEMLSGNPSYAHIVSITAGHPVGAIYALKQKVSQ